MFPATFLTNAFVDPQTLPSGLKTVVDHTPVTNLFGACWALMDGTPVGSDAVVALMAEPQWRASSPR